MVQWGVTPASWWSGQGAICPIFHLSCPCGATITRQIPHQT